MNEREDLFEPVQRAEIEDDFVRKVGLSFDSSSTVVHSVEAEEDYFLDLMLPGDLPADLVLDTDHREILHTVLSDLLQALQLDRPASLRRLEELLRNLEDAGTTPALIEETSIPVKPAQVSDFDRYFRVNRITAAEPALALVRSLLQTARAVMSLFCRSRDLSEARITQQIQGFISHTHLLARTFNLGDLR